VLTDRSTHPGERPLDAAASQAHVPPRRVRQYVRIGLLRPSRVEGRTVYLGEPELARLRKIRRLQTDLGLNLAGVEVVLRLLDEIERLQTTLDQRRR
jgi:MerR family transcriptional regulator/heat shock protein HspR